MQQEHQETNDNHPTIITTTHRQPRRPLRVSLLLIFPSLFLAPCRSRWSLSSLLSLSRSRSALFFEIPLRSTASLFPFGSLGDTARSKHAATLFEFLRKQSPVDQLLARDVFYQREP